MMKRPSPRRRRGISILELFVVMIMTAILAAALFNAFSQEVLIQRSVEARRANQDKTDAMELEITNMLRGAKLSDAVLSASTTTTGTTAATTPAAAATTTTSTTAGPTTYFQGINDQGTSPGVGCDRLTFTTTAPAVPVATLLSTDDYTTQQTNIGPVGGLTEVSLGTTAVGDAAGQSGLFERLERPSDGDPTQGGYETLLDPDIDSMGFQFWDGTEWISSWDTTTGTARLPEAVEVTYTLKDDITSTQHVFVVAIPSSDVTATNPYTATTTSTTTTGTGTGTTP